MHVCDQMDVLGACLNVIIGRMLAKISRICKPISQAIFQIFPFKIDNLKGTRLLSRILFVTLHDTSDIFQFKIADW